MKKFLIVISILSLLAGLGSSTVTINSAGPATDLQDIFEVLPAAGEKGWMGGDSDTSVKISGPNGTKRILWFYADTFVTQYDFVSESRVGDGANMVRNSIGIQNCTGDDCKSTPSFFWKTNNGNPDSFFTQPLANNTILWPVSAIFNKADDSVIAIAQRVPPDSMDIAGTTIIRISNVSVEDPLTWNYTCYDVKINGFDEINYTWFSGITWASTQYESDLLFIFGENITESQDRKTVLMRTDYYEIWDNRWDRAEFLSNNGWVKSRSIRRNGDFKTLTTLPMWESTMYYSKELEL